MWSPSLNPAVKELDIGNERVVAIDLQSHGTPVRIIGVYLPSQRDRAALEELKECLDIVKTCLTPRCVLLGDFNCSVHRGKPQDQVLKNFLLENNLTEYTNGDSRPTYSHSGLNQHSQLDYIVSSTLVELSNYRFGDQHHLNLSKHVNVSADLQVSVDLSRKSQDVSQSAPVHPRPVWSKCDDDCYTARVELLLPSILSDSLDSTHEIDAAVETLSLILTQAAADTVPLKKQRSGKKTRISPEEISRRKEAKEAHFLWVQAGKPSGGSLADNRRRTRQAARAQCRRDAVSVRHGLMNDIMQSAHSESNAFHKLVSSKGRQQPTTCLIINGTPVEDPMEQLSAWSDYYEELYTPSDNEQFNRDFLAQANELKSSLIEMAREDRLSAKQVPITDHEVFTALASLNRKRACDAGGIMAEHLTHASDIIVPVLTKILNKCRELLYIPTDFKTGEVTNIPKKQKSQLFCENHRGITITRILGKVMEIVLVNRRQGQQREAQSDLQFGFSEGLSPAMASLVVREAICDAKEAKKEVYIMTLDAKKAFDVVSHPILINTLFQEGCDPEIGLLIDAWYKGLTSSVKWRGNIGREIAVQQGVRQGGVLSCSLYKSYINPLLTKITDSGAGYHLGLQSVAAPTCADDVLLIAETSSDLQTLLDLSYEYSCQRQYVLHPGKSEIVVFPHQKAPRSFSMGPEAVFPTTSFTHLSILYYNEEVPDQTVDNITSCMRRAVYGMMGIGLHGTNGLNPICSLKIMQCYIMPKALYGTETMCLLQKQLDCISRAYVRILKQLQSLPLRSSSAAAHLLIGALPVEALIHLRILSLLGSVARSNNSLLVNMAVRQLAVKNSSSNSWFVKCQKILMRYQLPDVMDIIDTKPDRDEWKRTTNKAVKTFWMEKLHQKVDTQTSLCHIKLTDCSPRNPHQVWEYAISTREVYKAAVKVRMLTGVYLTMTHVHKMFPNIAPKCPLCNSEDETLGHMLVKCSALHKPRSQHLPQLMDLCKRYNPELWKMLCVTPDLMLQFILDCSVMSVPSDISHKVEDLSRNLCFSIHSLRTFLLTTINPGHISYKPNKTSKTKPKTKPKKLSHPHAAAAVSTPLTTTTIAQPAQSTLHYSS